MLSAATALTSLELRDFSRAVSAEEGAKGCLTVAAPILLLHLVQLTVALDVDTALAAAFLSHLHAPLTSLALSEGLRGPRRIPSDAAAAAGHVLRSLAAFPQLRSLTAVLPRDAATMGVSVRNALAAALPTISDLRKLESVSITAEPALAQLVVPLLPMPMLTKLHVAAQLGGPVDGDNWRPFTPAWPEFCACLHWFNLLHLNLQFQAHRPEDLGVAALSSLTQLTALSLHGWSCLGGVTDWQALAAMTALQRLTLNHRGESFAVPPECLALMRSLGALTALTLVTSEADERLVPHLAEQLPPQSLPALQELTLALYDPFEAAAQLTRYVATLPALAQLSVRLGRSGWVALDNVRIIGIGRGPTEERYAAVTKLLVDGAESVGLALMIDLTD